VSMLALHLLQAATVHVNTLLVQRVLSEPAWTRRLTDEDRRGITALFCPTSAPTAPSSSTWTVTSTSTWQPRREQPRPRPGRDPDPAEAQGPAAGQASQERAP
jgi:hypothetical protein